MLSLELQIVERNRHDRVRALERIVRLHRARCEHRSRTFSQVRRPALLTVHLCLVPRIQVQRIAVAGPCWHEP